MATPEKLTASIQPEEYGVEVLCASWNPVVAVAEPVGRACRRLLNDPPAADVDAFLKQFYRCQKS